MAAEVAPFVLPALHERMPRASARSAAAAGSPRGARDGGEDCGSPGPGDLQKGEGTRRAERSAGAGAGGGEEGGRRRPPRGGSSPSGAGSEPAVTVRLRTSLKELHTASAPQRDGKSGGRGGASWVGIS